MGVSDKARMVGINHVVLEVDDVEAALDFYARLFEFELRGRAGTMAFLDMGDQFLVLDEGRTQPPDAARHFGLVVDDRERVRELAEQAGVELLGGRGLDFRDPWGNRVQVVQYSDVQFSKTGARAGREWGSTWTSPRRRCEELSEKGLA